MVRSLASFSAFVTLPDIIVKPGAYRTRCGEQVAIDKVSTRHDFGCRGVYSTGQTEGWHKSGRLYFGVHSNNDIVERIDG